jgi:hypothetical protein
MTESIDSFTVEICQLDNILQGSQYEELLDEDGVELHITAHFIEYWANRNDETVAVVITDNDDIVPLKDFKENPFDRNKAVLNLEGIYKFIDKMVVPDG